MLEKRLEVSAEGKKVYDIVIENSFSNLAKELSALDIQERKLCIVTERRVASYYLEEVKSILEGRCAKVEVYIFQEGEASKNLSTVDNLYHFLITHEFDRKDMLLALGGGVTGDLTGFAAATFLRGVHFVQIPTTLLAAVDSSVGGKTAVDLTAGKNLAGAFCQPAAVICDTDCLKTLPPDVFADGAAEAVKTGVLSDEALFALFEDGTLTADPGEVIGLLAGGEGAMFRAVEGAEDSASLGADDLRGINLTRDDVVVGIAASGGTPYVIGGLDHARGIGAGTVSLTCNRGAPVSDHADVAIEVDNGPEVLTGSTRLKAGTSQKLVLNMLSTATMVRLGKVYGNLMVDVKATNIKLRDRVIRIVRAATDCSADEAKAALDQADNHAKTAIVMILCGVDAPTARERLATADGFVRRDVFLFRFCLIAIILTVWI